MKFSDRDVAALRSSGQFDAEWYLNAYPDVGMMGMDPAEHFLWIGRRLGRKPSAFEDGVAFAAGIHEELTDVTRGLGPEEPIRYGGALSRRPAIAAVVHVFYEDLIDEVCGHLANIPCNFSGFFAVREESMIAAIRQSLKHHKVDCTPHFVLAPNRGRNFGAFLIHFRQQIRAHDLCVHIHTKKSLRTGKDQSDWRGHLFHGLLGSREIVNAVLLKFGSDPAAGLIFPTTWSGMPIWCHNWLGTGHRVDEISRKLGVDGMRRRGFIDMAVGSMFWARTDAIAALLDCPWSEEDFEEEPIGDDGSMAHVIERALTNICRVTGHDYLEMDISSGIYRRNWSERLLNTYSDCYDGACSCVENADTISFDFYDTLFCRRATTPDDVHNYIGWLLFANGHVPDEADFYRIRKQAEDVARRTLGKGDVDLDDIYGCFPRVCDWSEALIAQTRQLEFDIEVKCLVPREDVIALARTAKRNGTRLLVVSDSYMPPRFFQEVLARHGLTDLFDRLYISSDVGMRKDRGDIWPYLREQEVAGRRYHHFGDNEHSDIQNALAHNIGHVYLLNTTVMAGLSGLGPRDDWQVRSPDWRDGLVHGPLIARFCGDAFLHRPAFRPIRLEKAEDIGYALLGPVYLGFLTWIIGKIRAGIVSRPVFLAREGWFLKEAWDGMRGLMGKQGLELPDGTYLSVSRRVTMGAMASVSYEPEFILRGTAFQGTIDDLLSARLGFRLDSGHALSGTWVDTNVDHARLVAWLHELKPAITQSGRETCTRLAAYLRQEGIADPGVALVDVGYSGTIQSAIQAILGQGMAGLYMITSEAAEDVHARGGTAEGFFSHAYAPGALRDMSMILEGILTAPHGQTIDYAEDAGGIRPVYNDGGLSQMSFDYLKALNAGAHQYLADLFDAYGPEIGLAAYSPEECEWAYRALQAGTIKLGDQFWRNIHVEDAFGGNGELNVGALYGLT